jgi:hypothetical protein
MAFFCLNIGTYHYKLFCKNYFCCSPHILLYHVSIFIVMRCFLISPLICPLAYLLLRNILLKFHVCYFLTMWLISHVILEIKSFKKILDVISICLHFLILSLWPYKWSELENVRGLEKRVSFTAVVRNGLRMSLRLLSTTFSY